jgi:spore maturation protein CgeB
MYIGITIGLQTENESIWINGIKMNAIFLMNALQVAGHKVVLLDTQTTYR